MKLIKGLKTNCVTDSKQSSTAREGVLSVYSSFFERQKRDSHPERFRWPRKKR